MKLLALGNPLLDLVVDVSPEEHLQLVKSFHLTSYVPQEAETLENGSWNSCKRNLAGR